MDELTVDKMEYPAIINSESRNQTITQQTINAPPMSCLPRDVLDFAVHGGAFLLYGEIMITRKCLVCGKKFKVYPSYLKWNTGEFCSKKCLGISQRTQIKRVCLLCEKKFYAKPSQIKVGGGNFCSKHCSVKYAWRFRSQKIKRKCNECGKIFYTIPSIVAHKHGKFCSRKCCNKRCGERQRGKNNPIWNGGTSFEPYGKEFTEELKRKIRQRDNFTCQLCGKKKTRSERKYSVHHIDYVKTNNRTDNLITLCHKCHISTNTNRRWWTEYFIGFEALDIKEMEE